MKSIKISELSLIIRNFYIEVGVSREGTAVRLSWPEASSLAVNSRSQNQALPANFC